MQRVNERELLVLSKVFGVTQIIAATRQDASAITETLTLLATNDDPRDLYAFHYRSPLPPADQNNPFAEAEGWDMYDLRSQMTRMKVPATEWRITDINADFSVCFLCILARY